MGYRSEVAYVIRFKDVEQRATYIELVNNKGDGYMIDALNECDASESRRPLITFHTDHAKWYDEYEDVKAHDRLLNYALEAFPDDAAYRFIRLGEDSDDNEVTEDGADTSDLYDILDYENVRHITRDF